MMRSRASNTVQFKCRRYESKRACGLRDAMVGLDVSVFGMYTGMEEVINREEPKQ